MPTTNRTALFGIIGAVFVSGTGIGSLLPILPLYLRERGASYGFVGVIVGAALLAQAVGQWPAGRAAERFGKRELMVGGLLTSAVASIAFVLPLPVPWLIVLRVVQGLGFAASGPAEIAAVADVVPPAELGRAYAWLSAARTSGFIAGPAIGGLLAGFGRWTVFVVTGVALAAAALTIALALKKTVRRPAAGISEQRAPLMHARTGMVVRSLVILSLGLGLLIGIYDVVWSLYMKTLGASDFVIGLSFTLWALPLVIATPLAGWASDRWDRRWVAISSVILGSLLGPVYPLLRSIPVVLVVGAVEAALWAFTEPPRNAYLMDAVPDERRAEAQGVVGTALTTATAIGSLAAGVLFARGIGVPFYTATAAGVVFALAAIPGLRAAGRRPTADPLSV